MSKDARTLYAEYMGAVAAMKMSQLCYIPVDEFVADEEPGDCDGKEAAWEIADMSDCGTKDGE